MLAQMHMMNNVTDDQAAIANELTTLPVTEAIPILTEEGTDIPSFEMVEGHWIDVVGAFDGIESTTIPPRMLHIVRKEVSLSWFLPQVTKLCKVR